MAREPDRPGGLELGEHRGKIARRYQLVKSYAGKGRNGALDGRGGGVNGFTRRGPSKKKQSQRPHPLKKQTPKGCGTQDRLIVLRVFHPPVAVPNE